MTKLLSGKTAIVTGGSRGIGAAVARRLAAEGADVALTYAGSPEKAGGVVEEIARAGGNAKAYRVDQGNLDEVSELPGRVISDFGRLDILVLNAAVIATGSIVDPTVDVRTMDRQFAVNVVGVAATARNAVPVLADGGRVIIVSSLSAAQSSMPGMSYYSASKAAVEGFARGWVRDLAGRNITVNIVQPGPINTDMNPETSELAQAVAAASPLGRYGQPHEIAGAVTFLAGPDASYVNGATLRVDGGLMA